MKMTPLLLATLLSVGFPLAVSAEKKATGYTYRADRFTDPFVPSKAGSLQALLQPFDPVGAELGGIISTPSGNIAVLRTTAGGTFIVKKGRIIDAAGRTVLGYSARVTGRSVVVWPASSNGARHTYKMRSNEGGVSFR